MKKISLFLITLSLFMFTSCIDYVQTISLDNDNYNGYMKVTLSKTLMAMAGEEDADEFLDIDSLGPLPEGFKASKVDTDMDEGFDVSFSINKNTNDEDLLQFLPRSFPGTNKIIIPFVLGLGMENESVEDSVKSKTDDDAQAMASLFLSTAKCRIMIDKKMIPEINYAYFKGIEDTPDYNIPFFDYGNGYCLEIPFILLISELPYDFSFVVIE